MNHITIWTNRDNTQWTHLFRDKESPVRPTTGLQNSKLLPNKEPSITLVTPIHTHSRTLEAKMLTAHIFIGCWWFWIQIYWKVTCRSSHKTHQKTLPCGCWLYRGPVMCHKTRLELWPYEKNLPLHKKVYLQCPPWVTTPIFQKYQHAPQKW